MMTVFLRGSDPLYTPKSAQSGAIAKDAIISAPCGDEGAGGPWGGIPVAPVSVGECISA